MLIAPVLERLPGGTRHWFMAPTPQAAAPHVHSQIKGVTSPTAPYPLATTPGGMICLSPSVYECPIET